jgi:hypothetical protein
MTVRQEKFLFTAVALWMFGGFLWAIVTCPPPLEGELPLVFGIGVAQTLGTAFLFLGGARLLSKL